MDVSLSSAWAVFARFQQSIENDRFAVADSLADEAALTDLVDEFGSGDVSVEQLNRRYYSLRRNRRRKFRCRRRVRDSMAQFAQASQRDHVDEVEQQDRLRRASEKLADAEWVIFVRLAEGETVERLARNAGISAGAFRARVFRLRRRLRAVA